MRVIYDVLRDGLFAINTASSQLAKAQQQMSSGKRISGAGDDPRGTQQAIAERSTINSIDAYTRTYLHAVELSISSATTGCTRRCEQNS